MANAAVGTSFKSYIIFDLETTTLPCFGPPKITEISAIAVLRDHIEKHCSGQKLPRVLNKLTLCIYPQKIIPLETERLTGLSNVLLENQDPFNERIFNILSEFIARMPKPACLIAHNGNRFDFPILQAEVLRLRKEFPNDLWCADSLPAFRFLYSGEPGKQLPIMCQQNNSSKACDPELESMLVDTEEFDSVLCEVLDSVESVYSQSKPSQRIMKQAVKLSSLETSCSGWFMDSVETVPSLGSPSSIKNMQKINETTPKRPSRPNNQKPFQNFSSPTKTPESDSHYLKCRNIRKHGPVKSLADKFNGISGPKSFKLVDIYQFICDLGPMNAHNAEGDTIMLLHCIVESRDTFLRWVDENAILFNSVQKMW